MKFLIDAQLPRRLALWLVGEGHDATHTLDLPAGNATPDSEVCAVADAQNRIVITKDDDFLYSHLTQAHPERLLLVATGNISNNELLALFRNRIAIVVESFSNHHFVELTREAIIVRE